MAKAIFIGINYKGVQGCQPLEPVPYVYAKKMVDNLTVVRPIFDKKDCLMFTDSTSTVDGVKMEKPTKENVTKGLREMVVNAKEGEVLLFYYCGHGANEYQSNRGALKTLNSDLSCPKVIYSSELNDILKGLKPKVNLTFLVHACFSGAMFSYTPADERKGIALTSVGPDIPSVVEQLPDTTDFTTFIRDKVIKCIPQNLNPSDSSWPTYQKAYDGVKEIKVTGKQPNGQNFEGHAEEYHDPQVTLADIKFLQPIT